MQISQFARSYFVMNICGLVVLLLAVYLKLGARYWAWIKRLDVGWAGSAVLYPLALLSTLALAELPCTVWDQVYDPLGGSSVDGGWVTWFRSWAWGLGLAMLWQTALILVSYAVIRRYNRVWWMFVWCGLSAVLLVDLVTPNAMNLHKASHLFQRALTQPTLNLLFGWCWFTRTKISAQTE